MPRRGRRRGNASLGCCNCLRYWTPTEEQVTTEAIKERSKTRILGRCVSCSDAWYDRHRLQKIYITFGVLFGFFLFMVLAFSGNVYHPALYLETFKTSNCTVYSIDSNSTATCQITGGRSRGRSYGTRTYICLRIYVEFSAKEAYNNRSHIALAYSDYESMKAKHQSDCTYQPSKCERYGNLNTSIHEREIYFKDEVKSLKFQCSYNPENLEEVLIVPDIGIHSSKARMYMGLMILVVVVTGLVLLFFILTCGCQYVCTGNVPPEIHQVALNKDQALLGGNQGNQPVIYTGSAVQIPPPSAHPVYAPESRPLQPGSSPPTANPQYPNYLPGANPATQPMYSAPQPGYRAPQQGHPPQQPMYPPQQSGYPAHQSGYLPQQPGYPPQQAGYPQQQPAYPPQQTGYPPQQPGYPQQPPGYTEQQSGYPQQLPTNPGAQSMADQPQNYTAPQYLGESGMTKVDLNKV